MKELRFFSVAQPLVFWHSATHWPLLLQTAARKSTFLSLSYTSNALTTMFFHQDHVGFGFLFCLSLCFFFLCQRESTCRSCHKSIPLRAVYFGNIQGGVFINHWEVWILKTCSRLFEISQPTEHVQVSYSHSNNNNKANGGRGYQGAANNIIADFLYDQSEVLSIKFNNEEVGCEFHRLGPLLHAGSIAGQNEISKVFTSYDRISIEQRTGIGAVLRKRLKLSGCDDAAAVKHGMAIG